MLTAVICLSVFPMPDPKSRMEGCMKQKIGRKEAHDMDDVTYLENEMSKTN